MRNEFSKISNHEQLITKDSEATIKVMCQLVQFEKSFVLTVSDYLPPNNRRERGQVAVLPHPMDLVTTFNWVFKYQPIASEILTQPSRFKRAESNLLTY